MHINSILSPDQGRTPAFHCGGGGAGGGAGGGGSGSPPADVITVERHPDEHTYAHTLIAWAFIPILLFMFFL